LIKSNKKNWYRFKKIEELKYKHKNRKKINIKEKLKEGHELDPSMS
jgi:hypothetical protein